MKKYVGKLFAVTFILVLLAAVFPDAESEARAGGGRSSGSRGSRSYSPPSRSYSQPASPGPAAPAAPSPNFQRPAPNPSGGFLRNFAGGMIGGLVGGMLFRSLGFGGGFGGGLGGSGIGIFEILLIAGICYLIYRMIMKKRAESTYGQSYSRSDYSQPTSVSPSWQPEPQQEDAAGGLAHIRQMDYSFDEDKFKDNVMDMFFKVQGAWMNRDLSSAGSLLTDDMRRTLQEDVERLLREKRVNKLENVAVRSVEITEAWQESGQDFITALIYANLLDYTVEEATGAVVAGSNLEPVKFEEFWTFTRPVGNNPWQLSGIDQK